MAFEPLKRNYEGFIAAANLKPSTAITGYVVDQHVSPMYPDRKNLVVILHGDHTLPIKEKAPQGKTSDDMPVVEKTFKDGACVVVNGAGNLKWFFANGNPLGYLFQIRYNGKKKLEKGPAAGKQSHDFSILIDKSMKLDVTDASQAADQIPF